MLCTKMRRTEGDLGLRGKKNQEFSFGHVKFVIPVRHGSRDVRVDHWNVGVWELTEEVWVELEIWELSAHR